MRLLDLFVLGGLSLSLLFFMVSTMESLSIRQEYGSVYEHVQEDTAIFWTSYFPEESRAYHEYLRQVDSAWAWTYFSIITSLFTWLPGVAISRARKTKNR